MLLLKVAAPSAAAETQHNTASAAALSQMRQDAMRLRRGGTILADVYGDATFLGRLKATDRDPFLAGLRRRRFVRDETLLHEGSQDDRVVLVLEGRVKLVTRTPSGRAVLLGLRGPGELLGELSAIDGRPRSADAVAVEEGEAAITTGEALRRLLSERPEAAAALVLMLVARLREADRRRLSLATGNAVSRVATCLLDVARVEGMALNTDAFAIEVPVSQEELGYWSGLSRQAVARALEEMRAEGWLSSRRHHVVLQNLDALRRAADG